MWPQEVIVREDDCGSDKGIPVRVTMERSDGTRVEVPYVEAHAYGRILSEDVRVDRKKVASAGDEVDPGTIDALVDAGVEEIYLRSVLTCDSVVGTCRLCYGRNLASGRLVDIGEAVGIIAAQSIGEPGTQLTMRTFHTGGVAGEDITHGLPRVVELFEARRPKGRAEITELSGKVADRGGRREEGPPDHA